MADQNLTAEIQIKTNSPLAKKQLEMVEKELMKLNKVLKEADKSGEGLSKTIDSMETLKLSKSIDNLNQTLHGLKKALPTDQMKNLDREMTSLNRTVTGTAKLVPIVSALGAAFSVLTNEQLLRRISRLARIASLLATIKGYPGIAKALRAVGRGFAYAAVQAEKFNKTKEKLQLLLFKQEVEDTSSALEDLGSVIRSLDSAVNIMRNLLAALDALADPARIKRLSLMANILGNIAIIKGYDTLGENLKGASDKIDGFANKIQKAKDASGNFDEKLQSTNKTLERVVISIGVAEKAAVAIGGAFTLLAGIKISTAINKELGLITTALGGELSGSINKATFSFEAFKRAVMSTGQSFKNVFSKAIQPAIPGIIGFADEMTKVGLVLTFVGSRVEQSENRLISFAGTLTKIVGIAIGGLSIAASLAITAVGSLIQTLSIRLFSVLDELSIKFEAGQAKLKQFTFIVEGFGKAFGTQVAGTLTQWNSLLGEVTQNSTTAGEEVRKSISALVKEAQILGFTAKDIEKVVRRANDVAAATGQKLGDVTQSLIAGFVGQSQAALNLGVDLREVTVAHGQLGKGVDDLSKVNGNAAKVQLRLNEFFKQTIPIVGAAKLTIDSLTGSQQKLNQEVDTLSSRIGGSADVIILYNQVLTKLLRLVNQLPPALFEVVGIFLQIASVAGIVIGTFLKYAAIIATLSSVFGILNAVIVNSVTIQQILTTSLGVVGVQAGVTTGAITGLSGALAAMGQIIKAQLLLTVKSLGGALVKAGAAISSALLAAAKAAGAFLVSIAPLVIKIGLVVGAAILFTKAIGEVGKELGPLASALVDAFLPLSSLDKGFKDSTKSSRSFAESMKELTGGLARTITTLASLVKVMVVGLASSITIVNRGILKMRLMLADAGEETRILKAALKDNKKAMVELAKSGQVAQAGLFTFGNESVIAMEKVAQYGKAVTEAGDKSKKAGDHASDAAGKIKRSAEEIAKSIEALQLA
ncbi:MAG TPA: hypothetical protein VMW45_04110, partial [Dehalococcoidia bacterium]|nr:hypothetical protein [Dehalococcoidia bacterium]